MENHPEFMQLVNGNIQFANKFYNILAEEEDGNIFFSPLSAYIALSMVYQGAAGETASKFASTLGILSQNVAACGCSTVTNVLKNLGNVTLHIANKIYVMKNNQLKSNFKTVLTESFLSEVELINFAESEKAAKIVNEWVESKTNSKIKDLIKPIYLNSATVLVLVNAIYFKGTWAHQFRKGNTKIQPFYISDENEIECKMMQTTKYFNYCEHEELDAKILEMKYNNENVSMIIILPNNMDGIEDLENKLRSTDLKTATQYMRSVEVNVHLPKFKIETSMDLKPILQQMGLGIIFTPQANFSEMIENTTGLYVSEAIQKAYIEVNEEGSEAAAATAIITKQCRRPVMRFKADHPFLVYLCVRTDGNIMPLFQGKIIKPNCEI